MFHHDIAVMVDRALRTKFLHGWIVLVFWPLFQDVGVIIGGGGGGGMSDRNSPTKLLQGPDVMAVHICEMCCSLPVCRQHSLSCPDISPSGGRFHLWCVTHIFS